MEDQEAKGQNKCETTLRRYELWAKIKVVFGFYAFQEK